LNGKPTQRKAQKANQNLSHSGEEELGRVIQIATMLEKLL
jgi:hypothetical protein